MLYTLKDLVKIKYGKNQKNVENPNGEYPIYGTGGLMSYSDEYLYNKPSVLIGRKGSISKVQFLDKPFWTVDTLFYTEVNEKLVYPKYLYYKMLPMDLSEYNEGTTIPSLRTETLYRILLEIPSKDIQEKVIRVLEFIDSKIELNNKINDNLLKLGDILYFENYTKLKEQLPVGYKVVKLGDVANNYDSKRKPMSSRERENHQGKYPYYGATSIIDYVDDYIFDDIYLLMGEDGTVKTAEGYPVLQYIWGKNWINNHTHVLKGKDVSTEFLVFALRRVNIESLITGAVQPKINQENMNKIEIIIGTEEMNKKITDVFASIMKKYRNITEENQRLTQLIDTLLPKLMNGEIDLDKIEI